MRAASGKWRPITPEGTNSVMVAPNGKYIIARSELNGFQLFPLGDGEPLPAKGTRAEEPVQWDGGSSHLYVWDRRFPARTTLVNPWTVSARPGWKPCRRIPRVCCMAISSSRQAGRPTPIVFAASLPRFFWRTVYSEAVRHDPHREILPVPDPPASEGVETTPSV
jgi:hypothetical protein